MLQLLSIKNYALIDEIEIKFDSQFNIITGETGAGKSILLGALGLVLGNRADTQTLKNPEKKCVIEAEFFVENMGEIRSILESEDIDFENPCVLRREISPSGKSRAFINDTPSPLTVFKDLRYRLIDVHSQHQNLMLNNEDFALDMVDSFAKNEKEIEAYGVLFKQFKQIQAEKKKLQETADKAKQNYDMIKFQYDEISRLELKADEEPLLEEEISKLSHADEIQNNLSLALQLFDFAENNVLDSLVEINQSVGQLTKIWQPANDFFQRIQTAYIDLKDLADEMSRISETIEANPERLDALNDRTNTIDRLKIKYKVQEIKDLLILQSSFEEELLVNESFDEKMAAIQKKEQELEHQIKKAAEKLTEIRKKAAPKIEKSIADTLTHLGMPSAKFIIDFNKSLKFMESGVDVLSFLFSANKQIAPQSIEKVASGGEISRFMLSLKALIAENMELPAIVFDEIDTGISGDIADKMGNIMNKMARKMQVISITHLPQVAVKGTKHFLVYKEETETTTSSHIRELSDAERVEEIAKMLSGSVLTDAAIHNAKQLLNQN